MDQLDACPDIDEKVRKLQVSYKVGSAQAFKHLSAFVDVFFLSRQGVNSKKHSSELFLHFLKGLGASVHLRLLGFV